MENTTSKKLVPAAKITVELYHVQDSELGNVDLHAQFELEQYGGTQLRKIDFVNALAVAADSIVQHKNEPENGKESLQLG